jgi:porin
MNEVFVNSGSHGLPSYDAGAALEYARGAWTFNAVGMNIGENEDGHNFNFWGAQLGYHPETSLGGGNYRVLVTGASRAFLDPSETEKENRLAWGFSFDQALGDVVGAFLRFAWQTEDAAVAYKALFSGGLNFRGNGWGRESDNIGVGYAYLPGGNLDVDHSQVFEAYYRAGLNQYLSVTADAQYMEDDLEQADPRQDDPSGWIVGLRVTAAF